MSNLLNHNATIEKGIESLGIPAADTRGKEAGQWDFNRGSASVAVGIVSNDRFPNGYFYVNSILMSINDVSAAKKEEFFRTLAEINTTLVNMKLCLSNDLVMLMSNRDATGLDADEVASSINDLSYYADMLDDRLKDGFK
jgi:hypothetical protein